MLGRGAGPADSTPPQGGDPGDQDGKKKKDKTTAPATAPTGKQPKDKVPDKPVVQNSGGKGQAGDKAPEQGSSEAVKGGVCMPCFCILYAAYTCMHVCMYASAPW
jgi:hypothetical protein